MEIQEIIRRRTLDLLLRNVKEVEDLFVIKYAIKDYENHHQYDLSEYKIKVKELEKGFWTDET